MYINFHQNRVSIDQSKLCTQNYLQKNRKLHKYATYNSNFETKLLSDMHHRITYLYINFQQNRVSRSVKTVHTSLFANICNLQLEFRKITPFGHAHPLTDIHAHFQINRPVRYRNSAKINYFHRRTDRRRARQ